MFDRALITSVVGRGFLNPLFYGDPLYCLPSLFQIFFNLPLTQLFLLLCLFDLMGDRTTCDLLFLLNDIKDLHISSLAATLVPQVPCGVFYATRHQFIEILFIYI